MEKNSRANQAQQPVVKLKEATQNAAATNDASVSNETPAIVQPNTALVLVVDPTVTSMELNEVVTNDKEQMASFLKSYIRCVVLRQFNIAEVNKVEVAGGKLLMNSNRTRMKLPKVKLRGDGGFAETLPEYYQRALPAIKTWLIQSTQNAAITQEIVESFA